MTRSRPGRWSRACSVLVVRVTEPFPRGFERSTADDAMRAVRL